MVVIDVAASDTRVSTWHVVVTRGVDVAVSRWPCRCGGYAGSRRGRVDVVVVDVVGAGCQRTGVNVAGSLWSSFVWLWGPAPHPSAEGRGSGALGATGGSHVVVVELKGE